MRQQLQLISRGRKRSPPLNTSNRFIFGLFCHFILLVTLSLFGCTPSLLQDSVGTFASPPAQLTIQSSVNTPNIHTENGLCLAPNTSPPRAPRLETTIKVNLTQADGNAAFLEFLIIPANEKIGLADGQTTLAKNLEVGDQVTMISGRIGSIQSVNTQLYFPDNTNVNKEGRGLRRVLGKSKRWTNTIVKLHTASEIIETTPEHPFYVNGQWIEAQFLKPEDAIASVRNEPVSLIKTETVTPVNGGTFVYNLKVEGLENFYVGNSGLLAHNCVDGTCNNCKTTREQRGNDPAVLHRFQSHDLISYPGQVNSRDLFKTAQKSLHNGKQNTLVLSGTHGTSRGLTAVDHFSLSSGEFFFEDFNLMSSLYSFELDKYYTVIDMPVFDVSNKELTDSLLFGNFRGQQYDCVIAAFCFSEVRYNRAQRFNLNRIGNNAF